MKFANLLILPVVASFLPGLLCAQDKPVSPTVIITGKYLGESPPLRDLPAITDPELQQMAEKAEQEERNPGLAARSYPFAKSALPKGPDPVWQKEMPPVAKTGHPS